MTLFSFRNLTPSFHRRHRGWFSRQLGARIPFPIRALKAGGGSVLNE